MILVELEDRGLSKGAELTGGRGFRRPRERPTP